ncbi:MAG: hypothetical protein OXU69_12935 [Gemmatimonadota bacterium]|nr:hypothetical protein [Gemmatimonadota bacterium]MDE2985604.1 hypothetical protein [Gemmatimonadota bacterium]
MTDFYVGYSDPAPPRIRRFLRRVALATLAAAAVTAAIVALGHRELPAAHFEFGHIRTFEGFVVADPYPSLIVPGDTAFSRYLLTAPGKFGADDLVASAVGRSATLQGTLAHRDGQAMIQVEPGTVAPHETGQPPPRLAEADLGTRYVEGEIVGSKCYLGVMNPGSGVTHRACAAVCIRGGVPPLLEVRRADGGRDGIVLAGSGGEAIGDRLEGFIATPVGMTGRLVSRGGTTFLFVDPGEIRRLR